MVRFFFPLHPLEVSPYSMPTGPSQVECLFYAITRRSNSDYERVAVVLGPQDVRLMFIDWSHSL
jgi:hypothetical protein